MPFHDIRCRIAPGSPTLRLLELRWIRPFPISQRAQEQPFWPSRRKPIDRYIYFAKGSAGRTGSAAKKTIRIRREDVDALLSPVADERYVAETRGEQTRA